MTPAPAEAGRNTRSAVVSEPPVYKIKSIFLSVFSGIVVALPFCDGRFWILAWCGFIPLFFAIEHKAPAQVFFLSYLTGFVFWSITIYWLIHVTFLGQILLIAYLALYFGLFGLLISAIRYPLSAIRLLCIPSLWVCLEYLRAHLLTGFGWAFLGYSQYLNLPIIQIADLFGVYGVSFLIMIGNVSIYSLFSEDREKHKKISPYFCFLFSVLCFLFSLSYGYYKIYLSAIRSPLSAIRISLIQGNVPQELKWAYGSQPLILDSYAQLTKEAALEKPDIIIWPEASSPGFFGQAEDEWIAQDISALAKKIKIPLLIGSVVREEQMYFNSALFIDENGAIAGRYDKLHLVPFGEYIPLKHAFRFLESIVPIGDFTPGKEYTLFKLSALRSPLSAQFAVLICFEDTIPELSRNFVREGADFLVNITNDAWFKKTSAASEHLAASVFRAVENRVPLVRAANTGISCFIDCCGKITARVSEGRGDIFIKGVKTENIFLDKRKSLYPTIGDVFIAACLALVVFCGIILKQNGIPHKQNKV